MTVVRTEDTVTVVKRRRQSARRKKLETRRVVEDVVQWRFAKKVVLKATRKWLKCVWWVTDKKPFASLAQWWDHAEQAGCCDKWRRQRDRFGGQQVAGESPAPRMDEIVRLINNISVPLKEIHVVVLGGGHCGIQVLKQLTKACTASFISISLVDENPVVQVEKGYINKFNMIQGKVVGVNEHVLRLESGQEIPFDFLVVATGALHHSCSFLLPPESIRNRAGLTSDTDEELIPHALFFQEKLTAKKLRRAERILILGGSDFYAIELAAELLERFGKGKKITILFMESEETFSHLPEQLKSFILSWLERNGVQIIFNVDAIIQLTSQICFYSVTDSNLKIAVDFDLCIQCNPPQPHSEMMLHRFSESLSPSGHIVVNDNLQIQNKKTNGFWNHIFALGDVSMHRPTMSYAFGNPCYMNLEGRIVAGNVMKQIIEDDPKLLEFPSSIMGDSFSLPVARTISLGQYNGSFEFNGMVVNGFPSVVIKTILEETKKMELEGNLFGKLFWYVGTKVSVFLAKEYTQFVRRTIPASSF